MGEVWGKRDAYDGDDVSMLILAGVGFLFPLHDCDEGTTMLVEVKEEGGMYVWELFPKDCRTGFEQGRGGGASLYE